MNALQRRNAATLVEKLVQRHMVETSTVAASGQYVSLRPSHCMTHDNSYHIIAKFEKLKASRVADPTQLVFALDHDIQNKSEANLARYAKIEAFAREHGIDFYPAGRGIGHQVMCEELYALPGSLCVASDSHSNMYGGLGCLGTPVVRTDAASIWTTSKTWWRIPPISRVVLTGALPKHASGKDVILALCSRYSKGEVLNMAVEFDGPGVESLTVEERLTIANMSTEWGALCGLFPADATTLAWVQRRAAVISQSRPGAEQPHASAHRRAERALKVVEDLQREPLEADAGCTYAQTLYLDLSTVEPLVNGPNSVNAGKLPSEERRKIHKAWLMSCVNSRSSDLADAAEVVRGKKVASWVEFYIAAASSEVQAEAENAGHWDALLEAGAIALPPGCGACAGLGRGTIAAGEVGVASTNRNFGGRMGHRKAEVYLASPATVAASAIEGYLTSAGARETIERMAGNAAGGRSLDIEDLARGQQDRGTPVADTKPAAEARTALLPGFPESIEGDVLYCVADDISTDGIYHGRLMYEDLTQEEMARAAMENYDPQFAERLKGLRNPILACGNNFGTGSSREQAAQCLQYAGISAVVAASYSATFVRNALNNGLPIFESPALINFLRERHKNGASDEPSIVTGLTVVMDFLSWEVRFQGPSGEQSIPIVPLGVAAQELIAQGGLEPWIQSQLQA